MRKELLLLFQSSGVMPPRVSFLNSLLVALSAFFKPGKAHPKNNFLRP